MQASADACEALGDAAIEAVRRGDFAAAAEHLREAAKTEGEYGDDPAYGPALRMAERFAKSGVSAADATVAIIIVNDGAYCWGADRAKLEAAMERQGWERGWDRGFRTWTEPEPPIVIEGGEEYPDTAAAGNALCQAVRHLPSYGPDDDRDGWDMLPEMRCSAEDGRVWIVSE